MDLEQQEPESTLSTLQRIKNGQLHSKLLSKELFQECVELLLMEGYTHFQMAEFLKCCTKKIQRTIKEIQKYHALENNGELAKTLIGRFDMAYTAHHRNLMKAARDKNASSMERSQAEYLAFKASLETMKFYQKLGYLSPHIVNTIGIY